MDKRHRYDEDHLGTLHNANGSGARTCSVTDPSPSSNFDSSSTLTSVVPSFDSQCEASTPGGTTFRIRTVTWLRVAASGFPTPPPAPSPTPSPASRALTSAPTLDGMRHDGGIGARSATSTSSTALGSTTGYHSTTLQHWAVRRQHQLPPDRAGQRPRSSDSEAVVVPRHTYGLVGPLWHEGGPLC